MRWQQHPRRGKSRRAQTLEQKTSSVGKRRQGTGKTLHGITSQLLLIDISARGREKDVAPPRSASVVKRGVFFPDNAPTVTGMPPPQKGFGLQLDGATPEASIGDGKHPLDLQSFESTPDPLSSASTDEDDSAIQLPELLRLSGIVPMTLACAFISRIFKMRIRRLWGSELGEYSQFGRNFERVIDSFCSGFSQSSIAEDPAYDGFKVEGAAMSSSIHQVLFRSRSFTELANKNPRFIYTIHVGAGWAAANLPHISRSFINRLDPLFRWLAFDGWGFHDAIFTPSILQRAESAPPILEGYSRRAWDQGVGRSAWFILGGSAVRIANQLDRFPETRQSDLWSGIGLACAYAGGSNTDGLTELSKKARGHYAAFSQGVAFAAKARVLSGQIPQHTDDACRIILGLSSHEVSAVTDASLMDLPLDQFDAPAYEIWRQRVRHHFSSEMKIIQ